MSTNTDVTHSDESQVRLTKEERQTWQYLKGAKKMPRTAANGHEYMYSEGPIPMIDSYDKPARTMLTSEGGFSRTKVSSFGRNCNGKDKGYSFIAFRGTGLG